MPRAIAPRGDDDDVVAGARGARRPASQTPREHVGAQRAGVVGDDARAELDDVAGHRQLGGRLSGVELEHDAADLDVVARLEARRLERADHAHAAQAVLDVRQRLLVLEVVARDQALDRARR